MLLKLTHETTLSYSDAVSETLMELRMAPRQADQQFRVSFSLAVGPAAGVWSYFDWLGNQVHAFSITPAHNQVKIVANSVIETHPQFPDFGALADTWPLPPQEYSFHDYLQVGRSPAAGPIVDCPGLHQLIAFIRPESGMPIATLAMHLLRIVHTEFAYEKGVTNTTTSTADLLNDRRGVCQDFTHLMIALARLLRIPARYVSGIVHAGSTDLRGTAQTHAWCELYFPSANENTGAWIGFDPTNNIVVNESYVTVAVGRDYRDVPPNRGVYKGKAKESIAVAVVTDQLYSLPQHLPGERIDVLRPKPLTESRRIPLGRIAQLEEQQQQQQQERAFQQQQQQQQ
jgi:transglutaminase-like putative cysteine protease